MMESSQENLQAWESFQRDFEKSKEIEGAHSNKLQYYMYLGKDSCVAIGAGILTDCYYEHECTCAWV